MHEKRKVTFTVLTGHPGAGDSTPVTEPRPEELRLAVRRGATARPAVRERHDRPVPEPQALDFVGLRRDGKLDRERFNAWLGALLRTQVRSWIATSWRVPGARLAARVANDRRLVRAVRS
jgi:hypothetical protein